MSEPEIIDSKVAELFDTEGDEMIAIIAIMRSGKERLLKKDDLQVLNYFPHEEIKVLQDVELKKTFLDLNGRRWCCYNNWYFPC